ncbi:MAG: hypothetical protein IJW89_05915 [Clostridia bacterium]|nr:hypothetical protein [Clostridia bacterium]
MTYFVDSVYGSDKADGTSRQTAWRSLSAVNAHIFKGGDEVLFKAGCTFAGNLTPKRTDTDGVIVFGRYGVGEKPIIVGDGEGVVCLYDFPQVELRDLAITGENALRGVFVKLDKAGACKHTHIVNCRIYDINLHRASFSHTVGGIICQGKREGDKGWFDDLLIQDNEILNVCRSGIFTVCDGRLGETRPDGTVAHKENSDWYPAVGEVIRGNYIDRTGGDGIVILGAKSPLMEWNTVYRLMTDPVPPCANAGIWPQSTTDCLMQYNEVGYANKPQGCADAQGYDVDAACSDTVIQYNYSHDNGGGFLLLCEVGHSNDDAFFRGSIVRNNLSVNDGGVKGELVGIVGPVRGATLENNTFYSTGNVDRITEVWTADGTDQAKDVVYRNNLIISNGKGNLENVCNGEGFVFDNNAYCGTYTDAPAGAVDTKTFDPRLKKDGESGDGRLAAANYVPLADSPALTVGKKPQFPSAVDFFGNPVDNQQYVGAFVNGPKE